MDKFTFWPEMFMQQSMKTKRTVNKAKRKRRTFLQIDLKSHYISTGKITPNWAQVHCVCIQWDNLWMYLNGSANAKTIAVWALQGLPWGMEESAPNQAKLEET